MHRCFILTVALRGRYGHRPDRGERRTVQTNARLYTEILDHADERYYLDSPTAGKLYGTTGTIWWRQTLGHMERRLDEAYFTLHSDPIKQNDLVDKATLDELFWLAIGCLPIRNHVGDVDRVYDRVYDLTNESRSAFFSRERDYSASRRFWGKVVRASRFRGRPSLHKSHFYWATAMGASGIKGNRVYYLEVNPPKRHGSEIVTRLPDIDRATIAVGVLRLTINHDGFLPPQSRQISAFLPNHMKPSQLQNSYERNGLKKLFEFFISENSQNGLGGKLKDLRATIQRQREGVFSRERAALCHELDIMLNESLALGTMHTGLWLIAILGILNARFFGDIVATVSADGPSPVDVKYEPRAVRFAARTTVRAAATHYRLDVASLRPIVAADGARGTAEQTPPPTAAPRKELNVLEKSSTRESKERITHVLLWASIRMMAISNTLDSEPLMQLASRMADVVQVSPSTSAPVLHSSVQTTSGYTDQGVMAQYGRLGFDGIDHFDHLDRFDHFDHFDYFDEGDEDDEDDNGDDDDDDDDGNDDEGNKYYTHAGPSEDDRQLVKIGGGSQIEDDRPLVAEQQEDVVICRLARPGTGTTRAGRGQVTLAWTNPENRRRDAFFVRHFQME